MCVVIRPTISEVWLDLAGQIVSSHNPTMSDSQGKTLCRTICVSSKIATKKKKKKIRGWVGSRLFSVYLGREKGGREPKIVFPAAVSTSKRSCLGISNACANEMGRGGDFLPREPSPLTTSFCT